MLTVSALCSPSEKSRYLQNFDAGRATWVVSDLRNKFEIQKIILSRQSFYEDSSVLRASELWRALLKRTSPEMKMVSSDFISTWVQEQLRKMSNDESRTRFAANAHQVVVEMMDLMASVYTHPQGGSRMREWFEDNPESLQRWGGWFLLSEEIFQNLMAEKTLCSKWSASYLQGQSHWKPFWERPLIFDLGSQLSQVEADLIHSLSREIDVHVLVPAPKWKKEFEYLLKPYDFLTSQAQNKNPSFMDDSEAIESSKALRFSGILGEAKKACEVIRDWLEQNKPPEEMALIAPDIEKYWPLLQPLLEAEGIPYSKDVCSRLQTLPAVSQWLAEIRLASKEVTYADLETAYFGSEKPAVRFEEFYSLFSELIDDEDLKRHAVIQSSFQSQFTIQDEISRDQWIGFSAGCWKYQNDFEPLEICFKEILTNTDALLKMKVSSWIHLLEQIVAKKEVRLQKGDRSGIQLTNLSAADSIQIKNRVFLGLAENMLKSPATRLLSSKEVLSISSQLGFSLEHPEVSSWEFDLNWLSENPRTTNYYFYPQTGFSGGAESPCTLWMQKADSESEGLSQSTRTRWDYVLHSESFNPETSEMNKVVLGKSISLSPSSIEAYRKCPFAFAAQKIFRLQDLPIMDFDVDRRTRGLLAHSLLEKLCEEPRHFNWSGDDLGLLIESLKSELGLSSMDPFIWSSLKERHVLLAQRFLKFEKDWLQRYPETKILAREKEFEFFWDFDAQTVAKAGQWKIRGRIDRLDHDRQGRMVLIDYKMTLGDYKNHSKWIENNQLQLALYMLALEEKVVPELEFQDVVGAFYFVLKDMNRDRGLKVEEAAGTLFDIDRKGNRIKEEKKRELLIAVKKIVHDVILKIKDGDFSPNPLEPEKCGECHWKNLCRAPHLN